MADAHHGGPAHVIGLIGYGAMGEAFAERMSARGRAPVVYDASPEARAKAGAAGLHVAGSPAELAATCDVIQVIVRTDEQVVDVVSGPQGVIEGARPGSVVILHSSITPAVTLSVGELCIPAGVGVLDACPTGVPDVVRAGRMMYLVGGPRELFEEYEDTLRLVTDRISYMGPLGSGNAAKLIHNLVTASQRLLLRDVVLLGEAVGMPYRTTLEMLRTTERERGGSLIERWEHAFDATGASPVPRVGVNVMQKDVPLAAQLARDCSLDLPLIDQLEASALDLVQAHADASST